ncbi:MAG: hypothetical protein MNPFHGCM_02150 [Gemmatimonadaceae bacterium]|nr:hypothetical protein [Gemmatimonadaceae bacterium]
MILLGRRLRGSARCILALVAVNMAITPGTLHGQEKSAGQRVFETMCVACHTIGGGVRIGPDLQGVTERRTRDWMVRFISDPDAMVAAGDSIAVANLAQYGVRMPKFPLTAPQVEAVVDYLGGGVAAPAGRPAEYIPTLVLAAIVAAAFTLIALRQGTKRMETVA